MKTSDVDAAFGAVDELKRIVGRLREAWPQVRILVRADSSFSKEEIMAWCESEPGVDFVFGLAKNPRLIRGIEAELEQACQERAETGEAARRFSSFKYKTLETNRSKGAWSRERRVVGKAECTLQGPNPRFVATSLEVEARQLYEQIYCARGEMENRLKLGLATAPAYPTPRKGLRTSREKA